MSTLREQLNELDKAGETLAYILKSYALEVALRLLRLLRQPTGHIETAIADLNEQRLYPPELVEHDDQPQGRFVLLGAGHNWVDIECQGDDRSDWHRAIMFCRVCEESVCTECDCACDRGSAINLDVTP